MSSGITTNTTISSNNYNNTNKISDNQSNNEYKTLTTAKETVGSQSMSKRGLCFVAVATALENDDYCY